MSALFSSYSQGENRVTSTITAVFSRINPSLVELVLQGVLEDAGLGLIRFVDQPPGKGSTPDAVIRASFSIWIETKTERNRVRRSQISKHLTLLNSDANLERLLVLTPDSTEPRSIQNMSEREPRLRWTNFATLVQAIESVFNSRSPLPTDREIFVLQELVNYLRAEGLVGADPDEVLLVAASVALGDYHKYSAYICQPNRTFHAVKRIAFYANGEIDVHVPTIIDTIEEIYLDQAGLRAIKHRLSSQTVTRASSLIDAIAKAGASRGVSDPKGSQREVAKVMFLSGPDDSATLKLEHRVQNDKKSTDGQTVGFTQGHRYISLAKLKTNPKFTSELED